MDAEDAECPLLAGAGPGAGAGVSRMNVIKTKIISLKLAKHGSKERLEVPGEGAKVSSDWWRQCSALIGPQVSYLRRFSVPYGQAVDTWKAENSLGACPEEEENPIYQSASFSRSVGHPF